MMIKLGTRVTKLTSDQNILSVLLDELRKIDANSAILHEFPIPESMDENQINDLHSDLIDSINVALDNAPGIFFGPHPQRPLEYGYWVDWADLMNDEEYGHLTHVDILPKHIGLLGPQGDLIKVFKVTFEELYEVPPATIIIEGEEDDGQPEPGPQFGYNHDAEFEGTSSSPDGSGTGEEAAPGSAG